jgi:hypothetical protein
MVGSGGIGWNGGIHQIPSHPQPGRGWKYHRSKRGLKAGNGIPRSVALSLATEKATRGEREAKTPTPDLPPPATRAGPYEAHWLHVPLPSSPLPPFHSPSVVLFLPRSALCESIYPPATTTVGSLSPPWTKVSLLIPLLSICFVAVHVLRTMKVAALVLQI